MTYSFTEYAKMVKIYMVNFEVATFNRFKIMGVL